MKLMAWLIVAISIAAATEAIAQSRDTARSSCPEGYWQLGSLCLNNSTGGLCTRTPVFGAAAQKSIALHKKSQCTPNHMLALFLSGVMIRIRLGRHMTPNCMAALAEDKK